MPCAAGMFGTCLWPPSAPCASSLAISTAEWKNLV
jgi:hypothetical protein